MSFWLSLRLPAVYECVFLLGGWKSLSLFFSLLPLFSLPHLQDFDQNTTATPLNGMTVPHPYRHTPPTFTHCPLPPFLLLLFAPFPHIPNHQSSDHTVSVCAQTYLLNWDQNHSDKFHAFSFIILKYSNPCYCSTSNHPYHQCGAKLYICMHVCVESPLQVDTSANLWHRMFFCPDMQIILILYCKWKM